MVLVAEDQAITALEIKTILKRRGFTKILCFSNGGNAIECLLTESPEFAILDILLTDNVSGFDIAKELKKKNIPFIFISAFSNPQYFEIANSFNPAGIIVKPFEESVLHNILDKIQLNMNIKE